MNTCMELDGTRSSSSMYVAIEPDVAFHEARWEPVIELDDGEKEESELAHRASESNTRVFVDQNRDTSRPRDREAPRRPSRRPRRDWNEPDGLRDRRRGD